jgi:hypothetical protein
MTNVLYALTVSAVDGNFPGMFQEYSYEITFVNMLPPSQILVNGVIVPYDPSGNPDKNGWRFDGNKLNVILTLATSYPRNQKLQAQVQLSQAINWGLVSGVQQKIARAQAVETLFDYQWGTSTQIWQEDYVDVLYLAMLGDRMTSQVTTVPALLATVNGLLQGAQSEVAALNTAPNVIAQASALLNV